MGRGGIGWGGEGRGRVERGGVGWEGEGRDRVVRGGVGRGREGGGPFHSLCW